MNRTRLSRRHLVLFAAALALSLLWGALSAPAPIALLRLQPAAAASSPAPVPAIDAYGAETWSLGVAP